MNRFSLPALTVLAVLGCGGTDFRNGYSPGEVETIGNATVYHLANGVFIEKTERFNVLLPD